MRNTLLLAALATMITNTLLAQPELDTSFSTDGKVTTAFGTDWDVANSVVIQDDGKILVAGFSGGPPPAADFALARYNPDGTLDVTFNTDGKVTTDFGGDNQGFAVAVQSDGRIVVVGGAVPSALELAVARYLGDGTPDVTFDTDGNLITDFGAGASYGYAVALQSDGKIVAAGEVFPAGGSRDFGLARYLSDGTLDSTFNLTGKVITDFFGFNDRGYGVVIQPDGKIVVAGFAHNGTNEDFALARYDTDGTLDATFSTDGQVAEATGVGRDEANALTLLDDGRIVVAGFAMTGANHDFALAQFNTDGTLDLTFSTDGIVTTDFAGNEDFGTAVAIQADGKIVVAGYSDERFALARYNIDGSLDPTFSTDGKLTTAFGDGDRAHSMALQPDGKIVVAGYTMTALDRDFAVARYIPGLSAGVIDFSVSSNSMLIAPNPIDQNAILEYTLKNEEHISIELVDMQGRSLRVIANNVKQHAGEHQQIITLPDGLAPGSYLIVISSPSGHVSVQVVKE